MVELTVGYVAGFIALGIFISHIWCSTVLSYSLAGLLRDRESAATWTVSGRILQSSYWPILLQSDPVRTRAVRPPVLLISTAVPLVAILITIAGVVTPLGLYDVFEPVGATPGKFVYVADTGTFGASTSPRTGQKFSQICSWGSGLLQGPAPCPYSGNTVIISSNGTDLNFTMPNTYTTAVAPIVQQIFSSGTSGQQTTISNYFDIEWRQLTRTNNSHVDNGTEFPVGMFSQIDSLLLNDVVKPIEGLIVNAKSGGVGFRNHTIPTGIPNGATWTEDILFVEPLTACVDTNLTLDFAITTNITSFTAGVIDLVLTDHGGFASLNRTYPEYNRDNPQADPDLVGRAYKGAWLNNAYTMMYLNVTNPNNSTTGQKAFSYLNSEPGKTFAMPTSDAGGFKSLSISSQYGYYLFGSGSQTDPNYTNPFNVTQFGYFDDAYTVCAGAGESDIANITNIYVGCGLLRGAPLRVDGGPPKIFEDGSRWSSTLHSCASAVRASIKTVSFSANGTDGLSGLLITNITDKTYAGDADLPLWGMEESNLTVDGISPVWGLVSTDYENFPNISSARQPAFHLVGYSGVLSLTLGNSLPSYENMPASDFPVAAMNTVYDSVVGVSSTSWPFDLVGRASMSIFTRWQNLSQSPDTAGTILNLIWTDLAASAVVGTKGVLGHGNAGPANETTTVLVRPVAHRIKYHYAFGIPAFVLLVVLLAASLLGLISLLSRRSSIDKVRLRLQQVSVGRVLTTLLYPEYSTLTMPPKNWSQSSGDKNIHLGGMPEIDEKEPETYVETVQNVQDVHYVPDGRDGQYVGQTQRLVRESHDGHKDKLSPRSPLSPETPLTSRRESYGNAI